MVDSEYKHIVFFDGDCILCNRSIRWLYKQDKHKRIYYAPLQGVTAQKLLPESYTKDLNTMVYWSEGRYYQRSTAILKTLHTIGGIVKLLYLGIIIPAFIRDWLYKQIAKNRHRFFPKDATCGIPDAGLRKRVLD